MKIGTISISRIAIFSRCIIKIRRNSIYSNRQSIDRIDIYTNFIPYILRNTSIRTYYHRAMHMSYNFTRKFKKYVYHGMQQRQTCKPHADQIRYAQM